MASSTYWVTLYYRDGRFPSVQKLGSLILAQELVRREWRGSFHLAGWEIREQVSGILEFDYRTIDRADVQPGGLAVDLIDPSFTMVGNVVSENEPR